MKKLLLFSFVILHSFLNAQQENQDAIDDAMEAYEANLDSIDKKYIKTKYLLNKGFMFASILEDYFEYGEFEEDAFTMIGRKKFKQIYKGLRKSDLKNNRNKRLPKFDFKALRQQYKEQPNTVPLGIVQARGEFLDSIQIEDHLDKVGNGLPIDEEYKKYFIFSAGALKKKVYSGNVKFEVIPELFHLQNPNSIKTLEIDFSDGLGFRPLDENGTFNVQYEGTGEKAIAIRFKQRNRTFTSYSKIKVITLDDEQPDMMLFPTSGTVESGKAAVERSRQQLATSRSSSSSGGSASVYLGCDIAFDQPVIVIEGFDPLNENNSADLRSNYTRSGLERIFRANGHDMVYFNLQRGGDDIIQNAIVVRNLIEQVNREKVGNQDVIVIGESMGGLVARLAIRSLEQSNRTHNISHYISFDAPHKGANLPVGFQSLVRQVDDVNILPGSIKEDLDDALARLNAKAAKQLLIRFNGPNPHPDFTALQNELNRVGFPQKEGIRNIAIVNGAVDGSLGDAGFFDTAGSEIIEAQGAFAGLFTVGAEVVSNKFGGTTRVSVLVIRTLGIPTTDKRAFFNFNNLNYDISSGGGVDIEREVDALSGFDIDIPNRFVTFVPLFSSLGSTRNTSSQTELNRSEAFLRARGQVPFNRVYGNTRNSEHIDASGIANQWRLFLSGELGLNLTTPCNQIPTMNVAPPNPRINGPFFFTCQNSGGSVTLRADNNPDFFGNTYTHSWQVTGPRNFNRSGNTISMSSSLPAGVYTVRLIRSFSSATIAGLPSDSRNRVRASSSTRAFSVLTSRNRICSGGGGPRPDPDEPQRLRFNLEDLDTENDSGTEIVIWPNPAQELINVSYEVEEKSEVLVSLIAVNNVYDNIISLGYESRGPGEYTDGFDVGQVAEGIYILIVDINGIQTRKKIIVKKK